MNFKERKINFNLYESNNLQLTEGLTRYIGKEFAINKGTYKQEDIIPLINFLVDYFYYQKNILRNGQTLGYGSWLLYFKIKKSHVELHELKNVINGKNIYEFDISFSIKFLKEQSELIKKFNIPSYNIPLIGQKIAVSKEIYSGSEVNGVRYQSSEHMTGWYLTSNTYNGDVSTLKVDYLFFLLKSRPDIAKYLALPEGYRFFKDSEGDSVWLDNDSIS